MLPFNPHFSEDLIKFIESDPPISDWCKKIQEARMYTFLKSDKNFLAKLTKSEQRTPLLVNLIKAGIDPRNNENSATLYMSFSNYIRDNYPDMLLFNPIDDWNKGNNSKIKAIVSWYYNLIFNYETFICQSCEGLMVPSFVKTNRFCCINKNCSDCDIPVYENHCHSCMADVSSRIDAECGNCSWIICGKCSACYDPRYTTCNNQIAIPTKIKINVENIRFDQDPIFGSPYLQEIYDDAVKKYVAIKSSDIFSINLDRGKKILANTNELNRYLAMYLPIHVAKLYQVFKKLDLTSFKNSDITIIDWGCGQGIGTLSLLEFLDEFDSDNIGVNKIILLDPSKHAVEKAELLIQKCKFFKNHSISIVKKTKDLNSIQLKDFNLPINNSINIFSNVMDIPSTSIVQDFSRKFSSIMGKNNYVVCVSPNYTDARQNTDQFHNILSKKNLTNETKFDYQFYIEMRDFQINRDRLMRKTQYSIAFLLN